MQLASARLIPTRRRTQHRPRWSALQNSLLPIATDLRRYPLMNARGAAQLASRQR